MADAASNDYEHPMRRVDDHTEDRHTRNVSLLEQILIPLVVTAVAVFVTSVVWANIRPAEFQPLDYSVQRVARLDTETGENNIPAVPGFDGVPAVRLGDTVPVIGDVCNDSDGPVDVAGSIFWNRLSPRGLNIAVGSGTNTFHPGCKALGPFENPMPQAVIDDVIATGEPELWQISGQVTIDEPNGGHTSWKTESFWVVP